MELADARDSGLDRPGAGGGRGYVWQLICEKLAGSRGWPSTGKLLAGWLVIDMDATLITAYSDK